MKVSQPAADLALEDIWIDAFPADVMDMEPLPAHFGGGLQNAAPAGEPCLHIGWDVGIQCRANRTKQRYKMAHADEYLSTCKLSVGITGVPGRCVDTPHRTLMNCGCFFAWPQAADCLPDVQARLC